MDKIINRILSIDYLIAGLCLTILVVVTFVGVIFRYFLNAPLIWEEEIQLMMITWTIYFGAAAAFRTGGHIAIDMIVDMFPVKIQKVFDILIFLVTTGVLGFLMMNGAALVRQFIRTGRTTNILRIPSQYVYVAIPVGCALMLVSNTVYFVRKLSGVEQGEEG
ncbi:MAG: TRAP transporter small permease [Lachnospiraceae bacterium]|nr:TRAP transporter small permease [Lachnospiraceae bacterium]